MRSPSIAFLTAVALAAFSSSASVAQTEVEVIEKEVEAFSVWRADGIVTQSGENLSTFVGRLSGPFFIETEKGPVLSGVLTCAGMLDIETDSGAQKARGRCSITDKNGEWTAFGRWSCEGFAMIGCDGQLELTGGLGRLSGVSGGGNMTFRSGLHRLEVGRDGTEIHRESVGIVFWDALRYRLSSPDESAAQ